MTGRILLSYWYWQKFNLADIFTTHGKGPLYPEVFADSGAFSAYSMGKTIDVHAYADWLHQWKDWLNLYANLDVKGSVAGGLKNLAALEAHGLHPIPVYHAGEPWSVLVDFAKSYPLVALGGVAGNMTISTKTRLRWLVRCFELAGSLTRFHGFGIMDNNSLTHFPFYSVDATSWMAGGRYGRLMLFNQEKRRLESTSIYDTKALYRLGPVFRALGYSPADIAKPETRHWLKVDEVSGAAYMGVEPYLRQRFGPVSLREDWPGVRNLAHQLDAAGPGLKLFLGANTMNHLKLLIRVCDAFAEAAA